MRFKAGIWIALMAISVGCADGDESMLEGMELSDSAAGALGGSQSAMGALLPCPAHTGCVYDLVVDLRSLSEQPGEVTLLSGRTVDDLEVVETGIVEAGATSKLEVTLEAPSTAGDWADVSEYDPRAELLFGIQLDNAEESALDFDLSACKHDDGESEEPVVEALYGGVPVTESGYEFSFSHTLHRAEDVDVFSFDILDEANFDIAVRRGHVIELFLVAQRTSPELEFSATYTCHSDGTVLDIPLASSGNLELDPDCPSVDDSGTVEIRVADPMADKVSCPSYTLRAYAQPSYL